MNSTERLSWDSDFFGVEVHRLLVRNSQDLAVLSGSSERPTLTYVFSKEALVDCDDQIGSLLDEKVSFCMRDLARQATKLEHPGVTSILKSPLSQQILHLALESGKYSRFALDPRIGREKFEELYRAWIAKSLGGLNADEVAGYFDSEGILRGLCTLKIHEDHVSIGLIAVDEACRGQGIGRRMLDYARAFTLKYAKDCIKVVTQAANQEAMNFYSKLGFQVENRSFVYHAWQDSTGVS